MKHLMNFKKFSYSSVLSILMLLLYLSSCSDSLNDDFDPKQFLSHTQKESRSYKDCDLTTDTCTYIVVNSLVFDRLGEFSMLQNISDQIDNILLGRDAHNVKIVCDDFISEYDRIVNDSIMLKEEYSLAWFDVREAEMISIKKRVISVKCVIRSFYGGAHPNEYVYLRNFIPQTGDSLGLEMIFNPRSLEELRSLAEFSFRKKYDLSADVSLESAGYWFEDNTFDLSTNFAFTEQGLWFYYNNYEIAPYSMGASEIVVPYSIIMHLFE